MQSNGGERLKSSGWGDVGRKRPKTARWLGTASATKTLAFSVEYGDLVKV